jgi:DNA polymerase-3 subunit epsilon
MDNILILDTETTGLIPGTDHAIEVAVAIYDLEHACMVRSFSSLIESDTNPAEPINNIPVGVLATAYMRESVWGEVLDWASVTDAIVAHRAEFDYGFSPAALQKAKPWVCSKFDLKWPKQTRLGGGLVPLALEHGLGVATAHRAMSDVELLCRLFTRAHELGEDLRAMMAYGMRPKAKIEALVSFKEKDLAKAAGFQWDGDQKTWTRTMAIADAEALPFKWRNLDAAPAKR